MYVNHPKILTFQKLSSSVVLFGLKIFHGFVIPGGRIEPAACLVFYLVKKNVRKSLQKNISKMAISSKNIHKTAKCSNKNSQKEENIFS